MNDKNPCLLFLAFLWCLPSLALAASDSHGNLRRDLRYKTTSQGDLHIDLYYPESKLEGEYPVVIYTHGGGWTSGDKKGATRASMGQVTQGLTDMGFCVVAVQYRLWKKEGATSMRDCVIDAKDAIRFLAKNRRILHVNTDRVFTFGDSAGGQMAQMLLLSSPDSLPGDKDLAAYTYKTIAGVSWYGPCDFENTDLFNHDGRPDFRDRFGPRILPPDGSSKDKLALYREMSPIQYLGKDSPPLLMIQGDGDTTIPVHHAHYMERKAREIGAPVETLIVKNAGHNWRKADGKTPITPSVDEIVARTIAFLGQQNTPSRKGMGNDSRMPAFSWATLPRYMHLRKVSAFTPKELEYLATFPLITFEKTTGIKAFGSTDAGTLEAARAVKKINPATRTLFYRNVIVHYPGYSFDQELDGIRGWNLVDKKGQDKLVRGRVQAYDLTNNRLRRWWADTAAAVCADDSIDGLFLDGNVKVLTPGYLERALPEGKKEKLVERYHQMMKATRRALGPDKLMIANLLRASLDEGGLEHIHHFDGSYLEGFEHPAGRMSKADYIAKGIATVQQAARNGKIIALTLNVGESEIDDEVDESRARNSKRPEIRQDRIDYCIALFLVMAEEYSYLYIHDGYDVNPDKQGNSESKLWMRELKEYRKPLGPPKGPAKNRGYIYTREFEHASAWLDIENNKGVITWK